MRIAILTTRTPHHCWFVRELAERYPLDLVMVETRRHVPPFPIHHPFEDDRDLDERQAWFGGKEETFPEGLNVVEVSAANDATSVALLAEAEPDIIMTFGVGRLNDPILGLCPEGLVNLHGGDPQEYRGLDTHLWAIYHGDFAGLVTTLHRIEPELDTGEIILQAPVPLARRMPLSALRKANTELCLELASQAIDMHAREGRFVSHPQKRRGRYYSFMPAVLKELCVSKFGRYAEELP